MEEQEKTITPETDLGFEPEGRKGKKRKKSKVKRIILWSVLGVLLAALIGGGIYIWFILKHPGAFFSSSVRMTATAKPAETPMIEIEQYLPSREPDTTPMPTLAPAATPTLPEGSAQPDPDESLGIVNIALFGIDAYENGSSTSGTMPHTDANLVLAINFDTNEMSLISIARDCLTTVPGYRGFYKFNGVFNVGGGMENPKAGFELSCRTAEEWLGGVSIPYYYGVDFQALIDLVDMIGGIDFDVDIKLITLDGRRISPGKRHLDGQGVMAYVRMRKTASGRDSDRTARQRKMLVAIFKKLKQEGKLSMIPDLLKTMGDNVYTNTSLSQTAALVNFARGINPDSIKTYSIQGKMGLAYDWSFCFIDQQARIDMLREVYGIEAEPIGVNSRVYEIFLHDSGFRAIQHLTIAKRILNEAHEAAEKTPMSEAQKAAYAACWQDMQDLQTLFDYTDQWTQRHYDATVKLTEDEYNERSEMYRGLKNLEAKLRDSANALNEAFGNPVRPNWDRGSSGWSEKNSDINEVYVDFR